MKIAYREIDGLKSSTLTLLGGLAFVLLIGLAAAWYMEHSGHHVTGMTNQIVWGMPHVFAIFLIVAASGALNIASIGTVFGKSIYKPLGRMSGLMAIALLAGGLCVLVLDLGRADRLIIAMTHYNFKSIFAWNILLYTGFFGLVGVYLWTMMDRKVGVFNKAAGFSAFVWRLVLTTGTGSIFGFLVARQAYDEAVMAPLFIAMSFAFGLAIFLPVLLLACKLEGRPVGERLIERLRSLLGVFVASVLYFVAVYHLTNLYAAQHAGVERFILMDGGVYTMLFWVVQIILGSLLPLVLLFNPGSRSIFATLLACALVVIGGLAQVYVIVIGGQAFPLVLFPGQEVTSTFFDGMVNSYSPTLAEIALGVGGVALALLITFVAMALLRFLPETLDDAAIDPHVG
jgi:Ni/Fe-hydrogenase subunit HybB-like protein